MEMPWATREAILAALIATGGPFDPAALYVSVATAATTHGPNTVLSDLTEPTLADVPRVALTPWGTSYRMTDGRVVVDAPLAEFRPGGSTSSLSLVAWLLADAATAGNLIAWAVIPGGVSLPSSSYAWNIVVRLTVDPQGRWSAEIAYNG
jgi:hypothetical protein